MKIIVPAGANEIMMQPESVSECGDLSWIATRFRGQTVELIFDTTDTEDEGERTPMLWLRVRNK